MEIKSGDLFFYKKSLLKVKKSERTDQRRKNGDMMMEKTKAQKDVNVELFIVAQEE